MLDEPLFAPLANLWLFRAVKVGQGVYGISWNDDIDLAEAELWIHGQPMSTAQPLKALA